MAHNQSQLRRRHKLAAAGNYFISVDGSPGDAWTRNYPVVAPLTALYTIFLIKSIGCAVPRTSTLHIWFFHEFAWLK